MELDPIIGSTYASAKDCTLGSKSQMITGPQNDNQMCKKKIVKSPINLQCIFFSITTEHWDVVLDLHPDLIFFLILSIDKL